MSVGICHKTRHWKRDANFIIMAPRHETAFRIDNHISSICHLLVATTNHNDIMTIVRHA